MTITMTGESALAMKYAADLARAKWAEFESMTDSEIISQLVDTIYTQVATPAVQPFFMERRNNKITPFEMVFIIREFMTPQTIMLILLAGGMLLRIAAATHFSGSGNLDNIKSKTVGDGQHGTARWANRKEIQQTYRHIPFHVSEWRSGKNLPKAQGLVLGCVGKKNAVTALVDTDDIHCVRFVS